MKFTIKDDLRRIIVICFAATIMALNIQSFVHAGGLYPGGATGLALLIQRASSMFFKINLPYSLINIILNAIPVYIGFRFIGIKFTLYSCIAIVLTSVLTDILPAFTITSDILLISIFGGLMNGVAISLCLLMNATSGGTDFISIYLSEKKGIDAFNIILGFNVIILIIAGLLFGWDKALYSIIFQFTTTQVLHALYKKYQAHTLFIVTDKAPEIYQAIEQVTNHAATIMNGEGCYAHKEHKVVYSVVSSAEIKAVLKAVRQVDPNAFINVVKTARVSGRFYHKRYD